MLKGEPVPDFEAARNSVQVDEKGKVINAARSENIVDSLASEQAPKRRKVSDGRKVAFDDDYRETEHLRIIRLLIDGSQARLQEFGLGSSERHETATKIHELLFDLGFSGKIEMLYVTGHKNAEPPKSKDLSAMQGFYYQRADQFNGRPCYQNVFLTNNAISPLGCSGLCISWSLSRNLWKIGQLSDEKAGIAICRQDKPSPFELDQAWQLYQPNAADEDGAGGGQGE